MSKAKAKGTAAESAVVAYLRDHGWPNVERRAGRGELDAGDIAGLEGVVVEVKNHARLELAAWLDEAVRERTNARATIGVVIHKRKGTTDVGQWYCTMTTREFAVMLHAAQAGAAGVDQREGE